MLVYYAGLAVMLALDYYFPILTIDTVTWQGVKKAPAFVLSGLYALLFFWSGIVAAVRRLHDCDRGSNYLLIGMIPVLGWIWIFVQLGCLRGTDGPNRFGPDPLT